MLWQQSLLQVSNLLHSHLSKVADKTLCSESPHIAISKILFCKLWDVNRRLLPQLYHCSLQFQ